MHTAGMVGGGKSLRSAVSPDSVASLILGRPVKRAAHALCCVFSPINHSALLTSGPFHTAYVTPKCSTCCRARNHQDGPARAQLPAAKGTLASIPRKLGSAAGRKVGMYVKKPLRNSRQWKNNHFPLTWSMIRMATERLLVQHLLPLKRKAVRAD